MPMPAIRQHVTPPDEHVVTAQEALEPLFVKLEAEVDAKLLRAALRAGWEPDEIMSAIDELRKH